MSQTESYSDKSDLQKPNSNEPDSRSTAEQISFFLALMILLGIIGCVGYLWKSDRTQSPSILEISTHSLEQRQTNYYVPFTVTNLGGTTATTVQVIAELRIDNEIAEWGEQTIDFLSRDEEAEGAFVFIRNPNDGELIVRVASYSAP